jgi:hypothetical protein
MARDHEDDDQRCDRAEASDRGSGIHGRKQTRVVRHDLRIGQHDDSREKQKHQQQIEQALDHDRRERRGRAELLAPGQNVRSQDLADASRHKGVRRESHHGCAERVVESRVPDGRQQMPPTFDTKQIPTEREQQGESQQIPPRADDLSPDPLKISVAEEEPHQANRQADDDERAEMASHEKDGDERRPPIPLGDALGSHS